MGKKRRNAGQDLWARHHAAYRDPHEIASQWRHAAEVDPLLLDCQARGAWWETVAASDLTLLVTREYEHLVMALTVQNGRPRVSYLHVPHPNGLAVDSAGRHVYLASTRNPNMVYEFAPCTRAVEGAKLQPSMAGVLLPCQARYLPGALYLHDLAWIGGELYANAVGLNAVVRLPPEGGAELAWWPRSIDTRRGPRIDKNYLQLNSIAAGRSLAESFFTASTATPSRRRPGHLNFSVDGRGVVFSGATRSAIGRGLTRPHSARLWDGQVWVDNSGYGTMGFIREAEFKAICRLPGWTRGLFFHKGIAFVGTSRVLPRYRCYAPGLDPARCETGLHAVEVASGRVLGSLIWPCGNQIFAIEGLPRKATPGFPFTASPGESSVDPQTLFSRGVAA